MNQARLLLTLLCLAMTSPAIAATSHHVGEAAPPLGVKELLQAPSGARADWASLRGKVVVVEFWGTWCGACIRQIPHLNELAEQMKDEPVVFISATDEDRETISRFLTTHPMRGWVAVNTPASTIETYGAEARPITYVIRPDGVIDAKLDPSFEPKFPIQSENLRNLLAGKPSGLVTTPRLVYAGQVRDSDDNAIDGVQIYLRKKTAPNAWLQIGNGTTTDRQGRFRFELEVPSSWVNELPVYLELNHPHYLYARLEDLRLLPADLLGNLRITLQDGNTLRGRMLDADGKPAAHVKTRIVFSEQRDYSKDCETDDDGRFQLRGLPVLTGELQALMPESATQLQSVRQTAKVSADGELILHLQRVVPPEAKVERMLGMTVVATTDDMQKQLFLDKPGIVVIDPGSRRWLNDWRLYAGDCICARSGTTSATGVSSFARLLLDARKAAAPGKPAWFPGSIVSFQYDFITPGRSFLRQSRTAI